MGGARRGNGDQLDVFEQSTFSWVESGIVKFSVGDRFDAFIGGSLNTQEVGVAVESIRAAVEVRNVAGDHLLVAAGEMAF